MARFGFDDKTNRELDEGAAALSISPQVIDRMIQQLFQAAGNNISQTQNRNAEIAARDGLPGTFLTAANRGAAIGVNQTVSPQIAQLGLQGEMSRINALRFLLGMQEQREQADADRTASIISSISSLFGSAARTVASGGFGGGGG